MFHRFAVVVLLLLATVGCSENSTTTPSSPSLSCAYSLSIGPTINGYPSGGSFPVVVSTTPATGCNWNAVSSVAWIHVMDGGSGSGNGSFTFTVDPNTAVPRTGTLTAAGRLITFNQSAGAAGPPPTSGCAFRLTIGSTINGYPDGGNFAAGVIASSDDCSWTTASHASWIHITSGASGTGTGATTFTVDRNPGGPRTGTLTIAGEVVTFNQSRR